MKGMQYWEGGKPVIPLAALGQGDYVKEWLIIGPFDLSSSFHLRREQEIGRADAIDLDPIGGERFVKPVEGAAHANAHLPAGSATWRRCSGTPVIDLRSQFPEFPTALAYAATYLCADTDTDLLVSANGTEEYHWSTMTLMLDGVEFGKNDSPALVRVPAGEHLFLLKIGGGVSGQYAWKIDVRMGVLQPLADGLGAGLARLTGFWRGNGAKPRVEVEVVLANREDRILPVAAISAQVNGVEPGPSATDILLAPRTVSSVRLSAPVGNHPQGATVGFSVRCGDRRVAAEGELPELPPDSILHVMQGFHCDPVWLSDQHHYNLVSLDNVRQLLDACIADPSYRVFLHEIDYLKPFVDEYPDYRAVLFGMIQSGQIALGSSYNQPNEGNCSGEALIRNILYGYGFHRHFLGGRPGIYHAWDVFGHTPQLSQIVAKSGLSGALWSKPIIGFPPLFRHMALDGTTLPHIRTLYGWGTHSIDRLRESTAGLVKEKASFGIKRHLVVDAGDFSCPTAWMVGKSAEMWDSLPKITMTGPEAFLNGVAEDGSKLRVTSRTESQYHVGTVHSRPEMKIANRMGENLLTAAERWATFAALMGAVYPDKALDKAWRQLLFAEHHDALSGTPSDVCYLDLMAGYREALELARDVLRRSTQYIAEATPKPDAGVPVTIFNPLNWSRKGLVTIENSWGDGGITVRALDGTAIPCHVTRKEISFIAPEVPSVGYTTVAVHIVAGDRSEKAAPQAEENVLENEFWRITLDAGRGGGIVSLVDKETGRELVDLEKGVGNDLIALTERGVKGGSPWEFWTTGGRSYASERPASVRIERTCVGDSAVIHGELAGACTFTRALTVRPNSRTIEAEVILHDYRRDDVMFVATFPAAIRGALPVVEDRFGTIVTKRNRFAFDYRTGGNHCYSDCVVTPIYNWVASGWSARVDSGNAALNLGFMGLVVPHDQELEEAIEHLMAAFAHSGVTCTPYFDDDDVPRRKPLEDIYAEPGFEKTKLENTLWDRVDDIAITNQWLAVDAGGNNAYVRSLFSRLSENVEKRIRDVERAEGWALAIVEDDDVPRGWSPMPTMVLTASSPDALRDAVRRINLDLSKNGTIPLREGMDFRRNPAPADDYTFGFLTNGTGGGAMEPDGTLTLMLTKSAPMADLHLSAPLIPEHREMVFRYAMFGANGSWRDIGMVRAGYEFDNPLFPVRPEVHTGRLPAEQSFFSCEAADAVVTAIKPSGNPVPFFQNRSSNPEEGVIVRAYNADGRGSVGRISMDAPILSARAVNLVEDDPRPMPTVNGTVNWEIGPYAVETICLERGPACDPKRPSVLLGIDAEPFQPVWCRYWQHNLGAHPLGYMPVGIYLDGGLPVENSGGAAPTVARLRVTINNNLTDEAIKGKAYLVLPSGWTAVPTEVPYDLAPREHACTTVTLALEKQNRTGLIKARMEFGGQVYQDVLEVGRTAARRFVGGGSIRRTGMEIVKEREPEWKVFREGTDILVRVFNPWFEPLEIETWVISPVETWGQTAGRYALLDISPRSEGRTISGRHTETIRFRVSGANGRIPKFWAWVKLACNGKPAYLPVPER